jgi:hypothetical protein
MTQSGYSCSYLARERDLGAAEMANENRSKGKLTFFFNHRESGMLFERSSAFVNLDWITFGSG